MGSLLVMLLLWPRRQKPSLTTSVSSSKMEVLNESWWGRRDLLRHLMVEAVKEALAGVLALLLVVAFVFVFYLYCLP
jgi:hypothetical protein